MSTSIYYFTGTGNCLLIARKLAAALDDSKIIPITTVITMDLDLMKKASDLCSRPMLMGYL